MISFVLILLHFKPILSLQQLSEEVAISILDKQIGKQSPDTACNFLKVTQQS